MLGRPSSYTEEIAAEICERLSDGESLRAICRDEHMPGQTTVFRWLDAREDFRNQYARARETQGHVRAEMAVDAALTAHDAQLGRLAYDALRWHASKLVPKVYGDKITQEHTGAEGGALKFVIYGTQEAKDADEWAKLNPPPA